MQEKSQKVENFSIFLTEKLHIHTFTQKCVLNACVCQKKVVLLQHEKVLYRDIRLPNECGR
jgi:hypothetical protein